MRQARQLLRSAAQRIRSDFGGVVLTATGVHSPQGLIIARVARELDLRCVLFVGATTRRGALERHAMLRRAIAVGAELDCTSGTAYETALVQAAQRWRSAHQGAGYLVRFGINLDDEPDAIIGSTSAQVANMPAGVERIVVAVGAGITAGGIMLGSGFLKPAPLVVCCQIAGYDRRGVVERIAPGAAYEWHQLRGVPYSRLVRARVAQGFVLDPIYEAKAWHWMRERGLAGPTTCFWVVGDSRGVREGRRWLGHRPAREAVA